MPATKLASTEFHKPVLVAELLELLQVGKAKKYIDATLGDGGHTLEFLKRGAIVLGLDYDEQALSRATNRITASGFAHNFTGALGNFKDIDKLAVSTGFTNVDGILFDLGFSSWQIEHDSKGLSFLIDAPLDMRLDKTLGVTASDLVNSLAQDQLAKLFFDYAGEKYCKQFAKAIVEFRKLKKLETTKQLAELISATAPSGYEHHRLHPATRVFQALRIVVNDELTNLTLALPKAARLLKLPDGRLGILSFHSLEDKTVKAFGRLARPMLESITLKPLVPSMVEVKANPRARSAKLRVFDRKL